MTGGLGDKILKAVCDKVNSNGCHSENRGRSYSRGRSFSRGGSPAPSPHCQCVQCRMVVPMMVPVMPISPLAIPVMPYASINQNYEHHRQEHCEFDHHEKEKHEHNRKEKKGFMNTAGGKFHNHF